MFQFSFWEEIQLYSHWQVIMSEIEDKTNKFFCIPNCNFSYRVGFKSKFLKFFTYITHVEQKFTCNFLNKTFSLSSSIDNRISPWESTSCILCSFWESSFAFVSLHHYVPLQHWSAEQLQLAWTFFQRNFLIVC